GKNPYARQSGNASRNQRESEKPGRITGTVSAPGSLARTHRSIASLSSLDTGDWLPATCSVNSISKLPTSSPSTSAIRLRAASSPSPGGTRQSTLRYARDGITLILSRAYLKVD